MGSFDGRRNLINRLPCERVPGAGSAEDALKFGRVALSNLVPDGCERALLTTFALDPDAPTGWVREQLKSIPRVIVLRSDPRQPKDGVRIIGNRRGARVEQVTEAAWQ